MALIKKLTTKKREFILMLLWPLFVVWLCFFFRLGIMSSIIFFYFLPSFYLSCKIPGQVKKSLFITFIGGTIWSSCDYIWELTNTWVTPTIFPFKFLGVASMENVIWSYIWVYSIVIFYEYFFEKDKKVEKTIPLAYKLLTITCFGFLALVVAALILKVNLLLPYSYAILGTIFMIPSIYFLIKQPQLRSKFLSVGAYFFYQSLVLELLALQLGYWYFPQKGQFIGQLTLFHFTFPFEEFIMFIVMGAIIVLSWYEFFDDDRK